MSADDVAPYTGRVLSSAQTTVTYRRSDASCGTIAWFRRLLLSDERSSGGTISIGIGLTTVPGGAIESTVNLT